MTPEGVQAAVDRLRRARRVLVSTGAGMSRESGIPTFRDAQEGLWARFDPAELATEEGFRADPARVWGWYCYRRSRMLACDPHAGHHALVRLAGLVPHFSLVTQNIDGLHQRAGAVDVIELHGSIHRNHCLECRAPADVPPPAEHAEAAVDPPRCEACGGPVRPSVVWFGEMLPEEATARAWSLAGRCDVLLVVGTSGLVWPAAELPHVARRSGATVIEVNPSPSEVTALVDIFLQGGAGVVLPALVEALGLEA
jgi:NAD-dependent deacetylase